MQTSDGFIWYDGALVPWTGATTHVLTHSLHYGVAVFEGLRAYETLRGPGIFRLREHTRRLFDWARVYRMKTPFSEAELMEAQCAVVRTNGSITCRLVWPSSQTRRIASSSTEKSSGSRV